MASTSPDPRPDDAHDAGGPVSNDGDGAKGSPTGVPSETPGSDPGSGSEVDPGSDPGSGSEVDPGTEVEVESVIDPATIRRAPRYGAFIGVGVVLGLAFGMGLGGLWLTTGRAAVSFKPGVTFTVILVSTAAATTMVAGLAAVIADRRSLRR